MTPYCGTPRCDKCGRGIDGEQYCGDCMSDKIRELVLQINATQKRDADLTYLRSILSRVREWVDNAALVETEEREIRGILEEGK